VMTRECWFGGDGKVFESLDRGSSFQQLWEGLCPAKQVIALKIVYHRRLRDHTQGGIYIHSPTMSRGIRCGTAAPIRRSRSTSIRGAPGDVCGNKRWGVYKTDSSGIEWSRKDQGNRSPYILVCSNIDPSATDTVFAGGKGNSPFGRWR